MIEHSESHVSSRHLLITGKPGCGKTRLIQKVVHHFPSYKITGFWTNEVKAAGQRIGFDLVIIGGESGVLARVNKKSLEGPLFKVGKYYVSIIDLETLAVPCLYSTSDLLVIDEIGRMEIYSSRFRHALLHSLDNHSCILATIGRQSLPFLELVKARDDTLLWELTKFNRDAVFEKALDFLKERGLRL
ncbi:MAG: nucleoside-triphosphatase [Candidatus Thorarchaeota archaeon]